jgi:hypothetical protein
MIVKRRFVIQLTPLLDLLIILVFALLLGLRHQARTEEVRARSVVTDAVPGLSDRSDPVVALVERHRKVERELKQALSENERLVSRDEDSQRQLSEELTWAMQQQERFGDLVSKLFQIPDEVIKKALNTNNIRSKSETEALRKRFRELAAMRGEAVVRHLLTFDEMRKRCDIWDLVISGRKKQFELNVGGTVKTTFAATTREEFDDRLFRAYKTLESPKDLVIVLLSYHPDARFGPIKIAVSQLPLSVERMASDRGGKTQFQFLVLFMKDPAAGR